MRIFLIFFSILLLSACTKDKFNTADQSQYPADVSAIVVNTCATAGCHNTQSAVNANDLDFSTWDNMFKGGKNGSSVIPYSVDYSFALYFMNTDPNLGLSLLPRMPYNRTPLSTSDYLTIRNWIANGAPDKNGFVKFSDDPNRKKFYVCMQSCNQVAVFDAATRVIMRYVKVGDGLGGPHDIEITPDGKYWALAFINGDIVQFFYTTDDQLAGTVNIGAAPWNIITFTHDSKTAFVSSFADPQQIAQIDVTTFSKTLTITGIANPHGLHVNSNDSILYATSQYGNYINKIYLKGFLQYSSDQIPLDQYPPYSSSGSNSEDPHQINFSPDESKYFVSCQNSNEVRILQTSNDSLLAIVKVGVKPQEIVVSHNQPYLFVTCMEDSVTWPGTDHGSVYRINYNTYEKLALHCGWQPHGIDVDDDHNLVYVANLNYSTTGPAPHHVSDCGGRNGYVSIIDMNTWNFLKVPLLNGLPYTYKNEVLAYPYEVAYRK